MSKNIYTYNQNMIKVLSVMFVWVLSMQVTFAQVAQEALQRGKILDTEGNPIAGAIINIAETNRLAISDINGDFLLPKTKSGDELIITAVGYITASVISRPQEQLVVSLYDDGGKYEQLVDLPFQKVKSKLNMASSSVVTGHELEKHPVAVLTNAFPGSLTGIAHYEFNSQPGSSQTKIYLRGLRTWTERTGSAYPTQPNSTDARYAAQAPIFIVDGIERDISFLDAFPIDNVTVLKDAGSTAIYGMRGANGAILVTTKRGTPGKTRISFTQELGYQMLSGMPQNLDSYEYAKTVTRAQMLDGTPRTYTDEQIDGFRRAVEGTLAPNERWKYLNTNYREEVLRKYSPLHRTNLNLSGGNESTRYFISFSYIRHEGVYNEKWTHWPEAGVPDTQLRSNRYNLRSNIDINVTKRLTVSIDLEGRFEETQSPRGSTWDIFTWCSEWHPDGMILNPNGTFFQFAYTSNQNPAGAIAMNGLTQNRQRKLYSTAKATHELDFLTPGLAISGTLSFDASNGYQLQQSQNYDAYYYSPWTDLGEDGLPVSYIRRRTYSPLSNYTATPSDVINTISTVFSLDYARVFEKKHAFTGFLQNQSYQRVQRGFASSVRYISFNAMANYVYNDRFSIQGVVSYMGNDNYEKGKRFGLFPATTVGYVLSEEPFLKNTNIVDLLKVRVSYGRTGQNNIDPGSNSADGIPTYTNFRYPYQATFGAGQTGYTTYQLGTAQSNFTVLRESAAGSNVTWELSDMLNAGVDFDLFKGKMYGSFDAFKEWRSQILVIANIPSVFGLSLPYDSRGKVETYGFETTLGTNLRFGDFGVSLQENFTFNRSKIIDVNEVPPMYDYQAMKGRRLGQRLAYIFEKYFQSEEEIANSPFQGAGIKPGNVKFKDINEDGVIDEFDKLPVWNSNIPEIVWGSDLGITWKGFDVRALLVGFLNRWQIYRENMDHGLFWNGCPTKEVYKTWGFWTDDPYDPRNVNAKYPRLSMLGQDNDRATPRNESTLWIDHADYFQLKNVEFAYTLPQKLTVKYGVENLRIYFSAYNIAIFGPNLRKPYDPEAPMNFVWGYPKTKSFSVGMNVVF